LLLPGLLRLLACLLLLALLSALLRLLLLRRCQGTACVTTVSLARLNLLARRRLIVFLGDGLIVIRNTFPMFRGVLPLSLTACRQILDIVTVDVVIDVYVLAIIYVDATAIVVSISPCVAPRRTDRHPGHE
jgi:hypothetical protein